MPKLSRGRVTGLTNRTMRSSTKACLVAALLSQIAGVALAQEPGSGGPPPVVDGPAADRPYDVPPIFLRSWATPSVIPKHGPKTPPDDNVVLEVVIDTMGRVTHPRVVKSIPFYDDQAIAHVRGWLFSPALKDGKPVAAKQLLSVHFGRMVERDSAFQWQSAVAPSPAPSRAAGGSVGASPPAADEGGRPRGRTEAGDRALMGPQLNQPSPAPAVSPVAPPATLLSPARGTAPRIEILGLDTEGADFGDWLGRFSAELVRNWHGPTPVASPSPCGGDFEVVVERDGSVSSARIVKRSENAAFDRAALKAIFDSSIAPLPGRYPGARASLVVRLSSGEP